METGLRRRRSTIELWRIAVLVGGAGCFAFLALGREPSGDTHEAILTSVRAIDINQASLQRDVLQARIAMLENYDSITQAINGIHEASKRLHDLLPVSGLENPTELIAALDRLDNSARRDEELTKTFETQNTSVQQSIELATRTLSGLHADPDPAIIQAFGASTDLGNLVMRFASRPDAELAGRIREQLSAIMRSESGQKPAVQAYERHATIILDTLPELANTLRSILTSQTSLDGQVLQQQYLAAYATANERSAWGRTLLGCVSALLCVYIAVLIFRLRKQTQRLRQQLDLESLVTDIKRRFAENPDSTSALRSSLYLVKSFFDAGDFAFAVIGLEDKAIIESHVDLPGSPLKAFLETGSGDLSSLVSKKDRHSDRLCHRDLKQRTLQGLAEGTLSAGSAICIPMDADAAALLLLEYREARRPLNGDEIRILGQALTAVSDGLKGRRQRDEKEKLALRLEHAQRIEAVGTLAGGIAHEFNNALGAILGYGELTLRFNRSPTRVRQYAGEILVSGHRAKQVIDQVLTFSRKRERVVRPFDIPEVIAEILPLISLSIDAGVKVYSKVRPGLPAVAGNPLDLQQVIMNLAINAAQSMQDGGKVEIDAILTEVHRAVRLSHGELAIGNYILLSVQDHGSGISPGILPHIFEPFFTTRAASGGTGLGLAAVHGHMTVMGGKIDVVSEASVGTRFNIYLPTVSDMPIPLANFFNEQAVPRGSGQIVLVAQIDDKVRSMNEERVAALGYEAIGISSLADLHSYMNLAGTVPDLLLIDPDLWEEPPRLAEIRAAFAPLKVVVMIGADHDGANLRRASSLHVVRKPVTSIDLANILHRAMNEDRPT